MPNPTDEAAEANDLSVSQRIQDAVETANAEDEKPETDEDQEDQDEADEEDEDDKDDDSSDDDSEDDKKSDDDEEEDKPESKEAKSAERKFKNLAAEDDAEYIKNIERAYENSTAEALRINTELGAVGRRVDAIMEAAQKDPDLAKRLSAVLDAKGVAAQPGKEADPLDASESSDSTDDPFLVDQKTRWQEQGRKEVEEIIDANPEIASDPELNRQVKHWMNLYSKEELRTNKRLLSAGEAMEMAMDHLKIKDKRVKQDVANATKGLAAPSKPTSSRKAKTKSKPLSDSAYKLAENLGVSKENVEKHAN